MTLDIFLNLFCISYLFGFNTLTEYDEDGYPVDSSDFDETEDDEDSYYDEVDDFDETDWE